MKKEPLILVHLDQLLAVLQKKVPRLVLKVDPRMVNNFNRNQHQDYKIIFFNVKNDKKIYLSKPIKRELAVKILQLLTSLFITHKHTTAVLTETL